MKWTVEQERIACEHYFANKDHLYKDIDLLVDRINSVGGKHSVDSVKMKLQNCACLDTGKGFCHCSRQNKEIFNSLK